jgi:hypothetical protein
MHYFNYTLTFLTKYPEGGGEKFLTDVLLEGWGRRASLDWIHNTPLSPSNPPNNTTTHPKNGIRRARVQKGNIKVACGGLPPFKPNVVHHVPPLESTLIL